MIKLVDCVAFLTVMFPAVNVSVFSIKRYLERIDPAPRQAKPGSMI
ncbi:hypothetical protein HMPREF0742_00806 [Rothia aeria F0184]|uniref:Uncharacterized protein n=1 Tax=Rothia aeria F0184 TaxID=888019 RepID=U7V7N5_9MICC|nr:hypothetical protein HMPREF0742_00806 [Rothia aeria F0184]